MEESKNEGIRGLISALFVTGIIGYIIWGLTYQGIMFYGFGHNEDYSVYVLHVITYALPLVMGLLVGFIAPFSAHKLFAIIVTTILGIGFIVTDIFVLNRFYTDDTKGTMLILFVIGGSFLSILHYNTSMLLSRKIREHYRNKKLTNSN